MKKFFKWLKWFLWDGGYFPTEEKGISEMLKRKPEPEEFPAYSGCVNMSGSTHYGEDPDSPKLEDLLKGFGKPRVPKSFWEAYEQDVISRLQPPKKKSKKKPAKKSPTKSKKKLARKK